MRNRRPPAVDPFGDSPKTMFEEFGINAGYVEELHAQFMRSPNSVDPKWRSFFEGRGLGPDGATNKISSRGPTDDVAAPARETRSSLAPIPQGPVADDVLAARVSQLVAAYRARGHFAAHLDPLGPPPPRPAEFELAQFGLSEGDLDQLFPTVGVQGLPARASLRQIVEHLEETYCRSIGVEFTQIEDVVQREWLQSTMELTRNKCTLQREETWRVVSRLTDAEIFEQFLAKNFIGAKRFSCEGAESMIAMMDLLIEAAGSHGVDEIIIGMAHRGRLNVLVNIMGKHPRELFAAFADKNPERFLGGGDVKYHLGYSKDWETSSGKNVHLSLAFNPSHLEFVNPVVEGRVRAKMDRSPGRVVMPLVIHGDAAFIGQGVVAETLNMAMLQGYHTGGTIHMVVNNQVGFTTYPEDSRSTRYCTDITRMLKVPVFHVNGEDPEAVIQVTRLAIEYRQRFKQDVVIDMYCFRKFGHNEGDEPRFTQPLMYQVIDQKPGVRATYVHKLIAGGQLTAEKAEEIATARKNALDEALAESKSGDFNKPPYAGGGVWQGYVGGPDGDTAEVKTGYDRGALVEILTNLTKLPEGFTPHPKVLNEIESRHKKAIAEPSTLNWGAAEHLAFATLVLEGKPVRITGQDARRGTFTHRHAVLTDTTNGKRYTPLCNLSKDQATFDVFDSPLSETGVLGFDYGYSLDRPEGLVIWEAQFGDFGNGAQVIIDQFIASAEDKWRRLSGLVMLLPHGYEGQGPEHSSARIERFLQLCAEDNIQVQNLTTPAQIFHSLRRQVHRPTRKPLVIFSPKSLLRNPEAVSTLEDLATGEFQRVIGDSVVVPEKVTKILLCSGKVYYDLAAERKRLGRDDVAIVRLEQLYPLNGDLAAALAPYKAGTPLVWVQDEPKNSGGWYFLLASLPEYFQGYGAAYPLTCVGRAASASPATGSLGAHKMEQQMLLEEAFRDAK